jgi:uncharacterized protein (DUF952 family)
VQALSDADGEIHSRAARAKSFCRFEEPRCGDEKSGNEIEISRCARNDKLKLARAASPTLDGQPMVVGAEWVARCAINKGGTTSRNSRPFPGWEFFVMEPMDITFHLVPQSYFDSLDPRADYTPRDFARDGFIHCTDGADEMARTANRYYQTDPEPHYYLFIDKACVHAPIRYEDAARVYPHIYGALNRDAIIAVRAARREANGTFLEPEQLQN